MRISRWHSSLLALVALVASGCTAIPPEQLRAYGDAYEEAREAGSLLYQRAAVAIRADDAMAPAAGPDAASPYPRTLGPTTYATGACDFDGKDGAVPASVTARCEAFATVTTYNEILVKLAAGDPAVAVRSELAQLSVALGGLHTFVQENTAVQTLLASAGPVVGPLLGIVDQAQKLANAAALQQELARGRPHVQAILQALREDVPRLYELERAYTVVQLRKLTFQVADIHDAAADIVDRHALPTAQPESGDRTAIVGRFDALLDDLELPGLEKDDRLSRQSPGTTPHTAATTVALRAQLDRLEPVAENYRTVAAEWHAYVGALRLYDGMLMELGGSLASLGTTDATNVFATNGAAEQWLSSALAIRDSAREIKASL
jgi:hypothetical protein